MTINGRHALASLTVEAGSVVNHEAAFQHDYGLDDEDRSGGRRKDPSGTSPTVRLQGARE